MIYHEDEIIQIIEGKTDVIVQLCEKIKVDKRYTNVKKLIHFKIKERSYYEWSMIFKQVSCEDMMSVKGYLNIEDNIKGLPQNSEKSAYLLMIINSFKDQNVMK